MCKILFYKKSARGKIIKVKITPMEHHVIFNIQNMPLNLKIKSLFIIFKQKNTCIKYYIRPWKTSCKTLFQPMRHVQDFFKKNPPVENHVQKITVAHGTSLAIYNTEACTFRYMMNIMI
jgi:hypothetical protein